MHSKLVVNTEISVNRKTWSSSTRGLLGGGGYRFIAPDGITVLYVGETEHYGSRLPYHEKIKIIFKKYPKSKIKIQLLREQNKNKRIEVEDLIIKTYNPTLNVYLDPTKRRRPRGYRFRPMLFDFHAQELR